MLRAADLIAALPYEGTYRLASRDTNLERMTNSIALSVIQGKQVAHLRQFAATLASLLPLGQSG